MNKLERLLRYGAFDLAVALKSPFSARQRKRRMDAFVRRMRLREGMKIIDIGGKAEFWQDLAIPLKITILNLPGELNYDESKGNHQFSFIEGDACNIDFINNNYFDIAFSNSVIEHVGDEVRQKLMAQEIRRLAPRYWVQTPSIWFPIEAHNHMPFWWFYPEPIKTHFLEKWKKKLPDWAVMIENTTVVSKRKMIELFPEAKIFTERVFGFTKSYTVFKN